MTAGAVPLIERSLLRNGKVCREICSDQRRIWKRAREASAEDAVRAAVERCRQTGRVQAIRRLHSEGRGRMVAVAFVVSPPNGRVVYFRMEAPRRHGRALGNEWREFTDALGQCNVA